MRLVDLLCGPWAITREVLDEIQAVYATHMRGEKIDLEAIEARLGRPLAHSVDDYNVENGVAVIQVDGPIAPKANLFTKVSGGASAQIVQQQIARAADDPKVKAILVEVDSPGGSVFGLPEAAASLRAASDKKPTAALVSGMAASGGYWIASAANRVYLSSEVAITGSIGVIATHVDVSRAREAMGQRVTEVTAGRFKAVTSPNAPLSVDGRRALQEQVDAIYSVFVRTVSDNRARSVDEVLAGMAEGRIFVGQQGVDAGLADGVLSRSEVFAGLLDGQFTRRRGASSVIAAGTPHGAAGVAAGNQSLIEDESKMELTIDKVKADHPEIAQALRAEGAAEGAAAERQRLDAIEAAAMPGFEALVAEAKKDPKATAGDLALRIVAAQKAQASGALERIRAEAQQPVAAGKADDAPVELTREQKAEKAKKHAADHKVSFVQAFAELFPNG